MHSQIRPAPSPPAGRSLPWPRPRAAAAAGVAALLALALGAPLARAAETLTLGQALESALADNPDLAIASAFADKAEGLRRAARAGVPSNPELTVSWSSDQFFDDEGERAWGAAVEQELWAPGQRAARKAEANARVAAASAGRAWAQRRLVAETTVAFARLAAAQRKADIAQELRGMVLRLRDATEQRAQAGDVSEYERDRMRVESASSLAELERVRIEAFAAREDLGLLMARALPDDVQLVDAPRPLPWTTLVGALGPLDRERGDVTTARAELARADASVTLERRERRPRIKLGVGWESDSLVIGSDAFKGLPTPAGDPVIDDAGEDLSFEVTLAIPLLRRSGEIAAALAERAATEAEVERVRLTAESQQRELLARGQRLAEAVAALDDVQGELDHSLAVLERAHELGRIGLIETLTERDRLLRARFQREDLAAELLAVQVRLAAGADALAVMGLSAGGALR